MVNYQRSPALTVGPELRLSWAVPVPPSLAAAAAGVDKSGGGGTGTSSNGARAPRGGSHIVGSEQETYRVVVTDAASGRVAWDSGVVRSNASVNVAVDAVQADLRPGAAYEWTVAVNGGPASAPARFVTALWEGFSPSARWIWAADTNRSQHFAWFRRALEPSLFFNRDAGWDGTATKSVATALLFVTAWQEPTMLSSYKVYIDGALVSLGPGRGEAAVLTHNDTLLHAPYNAVDVTSRVHPGAVVAVEGMAPLFQAPCDLHACTDYNTAGGGVLAQLVVRFTDGSGATVVTGDSRWSAVPADPYYRPTPPAVSVPGVPGETAYAKILEHIDASAEVVGWRTAATVSPAWPSAVPSAYQARDQLVARMARPLVTYDPPAPTVTRNGSAARPSFFVDYGRNFQGGVVVTAMGPPGGATLRFVSGELLAAGGAADPATGSRIASSNAWGYAFNWTLREGPQRIEQHNYMLFRYLAVEVIGGKEPTDLSFSAWGVKYEYNPSDSAFASSNATLNAVFELSRWTLDGGVVDTFTDSNTRERRPYECDGLIAATGRGLIQNDPMWGRHSDSWVFEVPTWPVEWMQMAPLLARMDYLATGAPDLFVTYEPRLYDRTFVSHVDSTGLVNTSEGRHLVGWDPPPTKDMFAGNDHTSVCNGWAVHGLDALSEMASAAGSGSNASAYASQASALRAAMTKLVWDAKAGRYCDGICDDPKVAHHNGVTTNIFTTYFGLVPAHAQPAVWRALASAGLTGVGDYGAFVFVSALAAEPADDGTAMLTTLTKCDNSSWCNEMAAFNATMTTESLGQPHQTMSHPWGTGAIPAVVNGVMGVAQTSPTWATFRVRPLLGSLAWANVTVPTLRGPIRVHAAPGAATVDVPCATAATLCLYAGGAVAGSGSGGSRGLRLTLDGVVVGHRAEGVFACAAEPVGCAHEPRVLRLA